ncbi:ribonuclease S-7-like [Actinidia eriantha]|uniref:ribonuclease S-7-like n=1 Tax=Actinidia eriantha TaxID=165200 RepID=UPI002586E915|nr:ribonuclease S-7-like [Actinidia eriantha]
MIQTVMLWPPTYCKSGNPCKEWKYINKRFGLHGLWPADQNGISIIDCRGPSIQTFSSPGALQSYLKGHNPKLDNELPIYWPSVITETGYPFWQGQWNKHGVCSNSRISPGSYFDKAVAQSQKFLNLLAVLERGGIVPDDTKLYTVDEIKSAVQRIVGTTNNVYISCLKIGQEIMLREIFICLDQMARGYVSCPVSQDTRGCGMPKPQGTIKFPPFPSTEQGQPGPIEDLGFTELAVDNIPMLL